MVVKTAGTSEPFGSRLRGLRERAGLTQEELAERADLSPHGVSALERGTRTRPYPHTIRSLADALGASDAERAALIASVPARREPRLASAARQDNPATVDSRGSIQLVVPPTRMYGREVELEAVLGLVRARTSRLITLTGLGGIGKSRLLGAVSDALVDDFPEGVVSVPLAPLLDATAVIPAIGRALGLPMADGPEAVDVVSRHLSRLRLLLVLDNFEHLLAAAPDVGRLTSMCPDLAVLVSSRSPLRVRGEREFLVGPLALPPATVATATDLRESASGSLVLDRVRDVSPRFEVGPEEARLLSVLCRRLAGIPLALELATAHLRVLSPEALLDRLGDVMTASGARDLPARQRTLRATLDWSYGLLSLEQQRLFRLLGTFRAGATLGEIEHVVAASGILPKEQVILLLEGLAEQSLIAVRTTDEGVDRVDILEPVAEYAQALLAGDEAARVSRAHAGVYMRVAEVAAAGYEGGYEDVDQVWWLARTASEEANLLVAVERALEVGDGETAGRITWALWLYRWLRAEVYLGRRQAERCLAVDLPPGIRSRVHLAAATMCYASGDLSASGEHWRKAARLGVEEGDAEVGCKAIAGLGLASLGAGDLAGAAEHFRTALPLTYQAGLAGTWMRSLVHVWLGTVLRQQGDTIGAVREIHDGLHIARERGDRLTTYVALYNLGATAISAGDIAQARAYLEEGITLSEQTQDHSNLAYFLDSLAIVESRDHAPERVAVLFGAAQGLRERVGLNVYGYYLPDEEYLSMAARAASETLGQDAYDDAVDQGRGLEAEAAVSFALHQPGSQI